MDLENYFNSEQKLSEKDVIQMTPKRCTPMKLGKYFAWVQDRYVEERIKQVGWKVLTGFKK